jgi:hypothetical protein
MSMNNRQNGRRRGRNNQRPQGGQGRGDNGNRIDSRARGNAAQLLEKYKNMARDAQLSGDRVMTEYYLQFADHYFRVLSDQRSRQEEQRGRYEERDGRDDRDDREPRDMDADGDEGDDAMGDDGFDAIDQIGRAPRNRDGLGREQREGREPRESRDREPRDGRNGDGRQRDGRDRESRDRDTRNRDYRSRDDREPRGYDRGDDRAQREDRPQRGDRPERDERPQRDDRPQRSERAPVRRREWQDDGNDAAIDVAVLPPAIGIESAAPMAPSAPASSADNDAEAAAPKRRGRPRKVIADDEAAA